MLITADSAFKEKSVLFNNREAVFIGVCCLIAAARVFLFAASAPFSADDDERAHFDLVYKYAHGWWPSYDKNRGYNDNFDYKPAFLIALYGTLEFYRPLDWFPEHRVPPPNWRMPQKEAEIRITPIVKFLSRQANHEALSPPVYYLLAAVWRNLGRLMGIGGGQEIYWVRFLNIPIYILLIILAVRFVKKYFPEHRLIGWGVPLLLAVFPQDAYYLITNDVLSPPLFLAAFMMLLDVVHEEKSVRFHVCAGLLTAAAVLVKLSNLAILALLVLTAAIKISRLRASKPSGGQWAFPMALLAAAGLPIAAWTAYNRVVFHDWLALKEKSAMLGWTVKPLAQWFDHPLFTPQGAWVFISDLIKTFWRGEMQWHRVTVAWPAADWLYVISTLLFLTISLVLFIRQWKTAPAPLSMFRIFAWCAVAISVLFLLYSSIKHDWGNCAYPSRAYPYMSSGRLISGVLVPFLVLYLEGLAAIWRPLQNRLNPLALIIGIVLLTLGSEFYIWRDIFRSAYNWFHLFN